MNLLLKTGWPAVRENLSAMVMQEMISSSTMVWVANMHILFGCQALSLMLVAGDVVCFSAAIGVTFCTGFRSKPARILNIIQVWIKRKKRFRRGAADQEKMLDNVKVV